MESLRWEVVFLLLLPKQMAGQHGRLALPETPKDAPYFFNQDIEFRSLGEDNFTIGEQTVTAKFQLLDERIWLAECHYFLTDPLGIDAVERKEKIEVALREKFLSETEPDFSMYEEYSIFLASVSAEKPEKFVKRQADRLAALLRAADSTLDEQEREATLSTRVRYSSADLLIVDWNGALIIDPSRDYQSDIDLLKIGNYQLLRYRILDQSMQDDLHALQEIIRQPRRFSLVPRQDQLMHTIVKRRLALLLDFEKVEQSLLQIGDWYSAQFYRAIVDEFYLDEWKAIVDKKLDSLRDINEVVNQELTFSWSRLLDFVQIAGWLILLVGYFALFIVDLRQGS